LCLNCLSLLLLPMMSPLHIFFLSPAYHTRSLQSFCLVPPWYDLIFESYRLFAETGTDECLFLLATCYYRSGKVDQAFHILQVSLASSSVSYSEQVLIHSSTVSCSLVFFSSLAGCHSFCLFFVFFITYIHSFSHIHTIQYIYPSPFDEASSPSPHRLKAQWEAPPCGAENRTRACLTTRSQLSHAALWA
jgi:hypothetical protein